MRKNWKKVLSLVLALAMVFSMNTTAFAADEIVAVADDGVIAEAAAAADVIDNTSDAELPAVADSQDVEEAAGALNDDGWENCGGWSVSFSNTEGEGVAFETVAKYENGVISVSGDAAECTINISANNTSAAPITVSAAKVAGWTDWVSGKGLVVKISANAGTKGAYVSMNEVNRFGYVFPGKTESYDDSFVATGEDNSEIFTLFPLTAEAESSMYFDFDDGTASFEGANNLWIVASGEETGSISPVGGQFNVLGLAGKVVIVRTADDLSWAEIPDVNADADNTATLVKLTGERKGLSVNNPVAGYQYALVSKNELPSEGNPLLSSVISYNGTGYINFLPGDADLAPSDTGYFVIARNYENDQKFVSDWDTNEGASAVKMPNPDPEANFIVMSDLKTDQFQISANDAIPNPDKLYYVVLSKNGVSLNTVSMSAIKSHEAGSFAGFLSDSVWVDKYADIKGTAVSYGALEPNTNYYVYAAYFDGTEFEGDAVQMTGPFNTTEPVVPKEVSINATLTKAAIPYGTSASDNMVVTLSEKNDEDVSSLMDDVFYRFAVEEGSLAGSAVAPSTGAGIYGGGAVLNAGTYYGVAYLNDLDEGYDPQNISSNMVSFQVLSANAYGSVSASSTTTLELDVASGEYLIDAGKTIKYGDLATVFFDEDGKVIPGLDWEIGSEAQYIIKNKKGELLGILKKGGAPVTVSGSGVLDITISKNGAGELTDSNYEYKGEREASIVIRVIDPDLQIEAVVAEIPFGYSVKDHQPGTFDIRNFVKVTDKNDGGNDLTNNVTYTVSTNSNPTGLNDKKFDGSHKAVVGETVYVTARYKTGTPVLLASGALKVGKQTAKAVFNELDWTWSVSESKLPTANISGIALFDEKGEIGAYDHDLSRYVHSDYTGAISLKGYDLNNRDAYNKYLYYIEPLKLAVNVSANSSLSANDYDFSVSECEIQITPTRIVHAEQLGIVSDSDNYIDQERDWAAILEKLSANDLKKLAEKLSGSSEVYEKADLVVTAELVYDGSDINHSGSVPERLWNYYIRDDGNSKFYLWDFDYQYIKDVKLNFQFIEQKYDPNATAKLTMDTINDVTYDGFKHVAGEAGDNKSQTANLNVNVYSGGQRLVYGTDYKLTYKNNVNACEDYTKVEAKKMPTVIVTGLGNYKGMEYIAYFNIKKADVDWIDEIGGLKLYYKANKSGKFTIKPKFGVWNRATVKAINIKKENITFRAVSANEENLLKANAVVADGTDGKGTLPGDKAMKLRLIAKVSGGTNFKDGETILGEFYVLPAKGGAVTAKFNSKKQATINWSATKTSVSAADFVGKDLANLKITTKAKGVTVSAADFGDPSFGYFVDRKEGWGGDVTEQVGAYEIYLNPTEKAVLEKNIAPDTVKVKVTFKPTEKLSKLKSQFSMSSYKVYDGASWNEAKAYDKKAGITLPDPAYGAQVSINAPKTLKNNLWAYLKQANGKSDADYEEIVSNNGLQGWLNDGDYVSPYVPGYYNNAVGTYKIVIEGSGAYSVKEKVTLTYKIAPFKADDVKIRVISANYGTAVDPVYKNGEIFFNKGGYVFDYTNAGPFDTDVFGHVNIKLQTKDKDGKFVDNDDLTDYLYNSKVKITTDKNGAVKVTVTGIKNGQGKVVVKGAVKNLTENMTAKASLSNNASIVVVNKGLTTDKASKYDKSIVLEQYSAAKGVDAEGNYKTVKLTKNEYSMTGTFAQGLSANNATFTGTGSFSGDKKVSGNDVTLSFLDRYGVAVGEKAITKGYKFNAATITGSATSLTYKNGLRVMPEKFTIQGKSGQGNIEITTASANNLDLEEGGQYVKDLGVKVFVKFANNRDISNKAQATIYFVPVDSTAKFIGSKTVKFKITK